MLDANLANLLALKIGSYNSSFFPKIQNHSPHLGERLFTLVDGFYFTIKGLHFIRFHIIAKKKVMYQKR